MPSLRHPRHRNASLTPLLSKKKRAAFSYVRHPYEWIIPLSAYTIPWSPSHLPCMFVSAKAPLGTPKTVLGVSNFHTALSYDGFKRFDTDCTDTSYGRFDTSRGFLSSLPHLPCMGALERIPLGVPRTARVTTRVLGTSLYDGFKRFPYSHTRRPYIYLPVS